jgi:hypothetical protein
MPSDRFFGDDRRTIRGEMRRQEAQRMTGGVSKIRHSAGVRNPGPQLLNRYKLGAWGDAHLGGGRFGHDGCEQVNITVDRLDVKCPESDGG